MHHRMREVHNLNLVLAEMEGMVQVAVVELDRLLFNTIRQLLTQSIPIMGPPKMPSAQAVPAVQVAKAAQAGSSSTTVSRRQFPPAHSWTRTTKSFWTSTDGCSSRRRAL